MDRRGEGSGEDRAGLVSLGLLMQLVGSVVAAYLIVKALEPVLDRVFVGAWYPRWDWKQYVGSELVPSRGPPWYVVLLAGIGLLRALAHRRAGSAVLYRPAGALVAVVTYAAVALGHTALCLLTFRIHRDNQSLAWAVAACMSLGWPVVLLVAVGRPEVRRILRSGPAVTGASAPDQVGTLMVFFGLVGGLVALFALSASIDGFVTWSWPPSWLPIGVTVLLCVRSATHARVGIGLVGRDLGSSEPMDLARYVRVGLATAVLSWVAILIVQWAYLHVERTDPPLSEHVELVRKGMAVYLLFVWPLLLQRMARVRADADAPSVAAPGSPGGLPACGWLLLAAGVVQLGYVGLSLALGEARLADISMSFVDLPMSDRYVSRGPWVHLLLAVPQIWVAFELLRGSPRRRRAATLYAACASIAVVLSIRADIALLMLAVDRGLPDPTALVPYLPVAFSLLVPVATLVFVQHQLRREAARAPVDSSSGGG